MRNNYLRSYGYYQDGNTLRLSENRSLYKYNHAYPYQGENIAIKKGKKGKRSNKAINFKHTSKTSVAGHVSKSYALGHKSLVKADGQVISNSYAMTAALKPAQRFAKYAPAAEQKIKISDKNKLKAYKKQETEASLRLNSLAGTLSPPLTILLVGMVLCVLYFGFDYLRLSASIDGHMNTLQSLETELESLKNTNDALEEGIDTSINLNEIYDAAVNRLGMVHAGTGSVITYDKTESEYVRQYDVITEDGD